MPDQSPDTLAIESAGVKRLNSRPVMIVCGICTLLLIGLIYAVNQSAKRSQPKAAAIADQPDQKHTVQPSAASVQELTKGFPEGGAVVDATAPNFVPPPEKKSSAAIVAGSVEASKGGTRTNKLTPEEEWVQSYRTAQQKKFQLYEAALNAPTRISTNTGDTKRPGAASGLSGSFGSIGGADGGIGAAKQRMQQGSDMQSAALKAALGNTDPNGQDEKNDFQQKELRSGYLTATREAALSAYEIKMGTVIPAIMISGINSDLPGEVIAQVSQDVWDSATGRYLLIPQGSRLVGVYDSHVMFGQNRVLLAWTRINFPDASSIDLGNMSGADQAGYAGFSDKVNNHYTKIFGSALLMSIISAGVQLSQPQQTGVNSQQTASQTASAAMAQELGKTGTAILQKNLSIQPTLEIRPGYRFNVMVSKDVLLPSPYTYSPTVASR